MGKRGSGQAWALLARNRGGLHPTTAQCISCSSVHGPDAWGRDPQGTSSPRRGEHEFGASPEPSQPVEASHPFGSVLVCRVAPVSNPASCSTPPPPTPNRPNPLKQTINPAELSKAERGYCTALWLNSALIPEQTALILARGSLPPAHQPICKRSAPWVRDGPTWGTDGPGPPSAGTPGMLWPPGRAREDGVSPRKWGRGHVR